MAVGGGKTLTIYLAADLKKFNQGLNQAEGGLKGFAGSLKNMVGPAAIGAGIAIAGLATKMAVDGVQAAVADEAAMAKLALTMENVGLAHDTKRVEDYISVLERSTGVADDDLRPAYDRLIRSIGDTAEAERMLSLAMDISAGTGKSLDSVVQALGRAYDGNTAGLSRLGAGIDSATLKSGDMTRIVASLSDTFSGQAAVAADTVSGRFKVLQQAVDNLGEAFGKGLLSGVTDATTGTTDMVATMQKLEPMLEDTGETIANVAGHLVDLGSALVSVEGMLNDAREGTSGWSTALDTLINSLNPLQPVLDWLGFGFEVVTDVLGKTETATDAAAAAASNAVPKWNLLYGATMKATEAHIAYLAAHGVKINVIKEANKDYQDLAARLAKVNTFTSIELEQEEEKQNQYQSTGSAVETLTKKEKELIKTFGLKNEALAANRNALSFWTQELSKANSEIADFTTNMQNNLMAGVDLGAAYESGFNEQGERVGSGVVAGFQAMIDEANWFGNVLNQLKSEQVDQGLIDYLASQGADIGGKLGQEMLGDKGLLAKLNEQWVNVQSTTKTLAESLVPEFMIAGQESALTMVDSISEQMAKEVKRLAKIGKKIAQPLGQSFRAELMKDVAAALKEVEASGAAGRAEAVANAQARQVALTNAAVAQALQNLVRSADARNGAPIAPVLS